MTKPHTKQLQATLKLDVNDDTIRHTLVVIEGDTKVGTFELQVNKRGDTDFGSINLPAGNYVLLCTVPGHQSMKADLTVK